MLQQVQMNFKKPLLHTEKPLHQVRAIDILPPAPTVAVVCPSCDSEVDTMEIIEEKGSVKCVNCR